ncbi:MAG: aspartate/glutamate racemase family protein [Eubacteriaceae bacterium]|jgi:Asp/Glu/hydantoin racemase|nr:aspartate/glutamate racemase family protein [Eubacteriaceae bacterium]
MGYLDDSNNKIKVRMKKGQTISGFPIGILYLEDVHYPLMPGNVVNGYTFDFPVRYRAVEGLDIPNLVFKEPTEEVYQSILKAGKSLEADGCRAISGACGFFGNYQRKLADDLNIPVALSSLLQLPWIGTILKPGQKIGVLTADQSSLTDNVFENCSISRELRKRLIMKDLRNEPEFSCIPEARGEFDNGTVQQEVVAKALEITEDDPDVRAILLECSDMPPYAFAVQQATGCMVFDYTTLIKWLYSAAAQMPYKGFI